MRYYNIYLYSQCPIEQNTESYPSYWIWKIESCAQNASIPNGCLRMSLIELQQYKQDNKIIYNNWISSKTESSVIIDKKVKKAINSANNIINKFCAENILLGITQYGKTKIIADALKDVFYYAQTGSLYECLTAMDAITITEEMAPFLTNERRIELKNKIVNVISNL